MEPLRGTQIEMRGHPSFGVRNSHTIVGPTSGSLQRDTQSAYLDKGPRLDGAEEPSFERAGSKGDESAFQTDGDGMRPVVCSQLREDVLHVPLDGVFSNGE